MAGAAIAEGAYLTMGGSLAGEGSVAGAEGGRWRSVEVTMKLAKGKTGTAAAKSFIKAYALADIASQFEHQEQIHDASDSRSGSLPGIRLLPWMRDFHQKYVRGIEK